MPENQTPQNFQWQNMSNQQSPVQAPVDSLNQTQQTVKTQGDSFVQNVQQSESVDNSALIQQLLVQQQQYQQQYNQLINYVKQTPNLPLDQVNQIKQQLDQLNNLFVAWKQKLQSLWYNSVQVNKPTEIKTWSKNNFSLKKMAIWCGVILFLMFLCFWIMVYSLIQNPEALAWIKISANTAKMILSLFVWLVFWWAVLLMLGLVISNIYRLITSKNQSKRKTILWLVWGVFWMAVFWWIMWVLFLFINKIQKVEVDIQYPTAIPYLVSMDQLDDVENLSFKHNRVSLYDKNWNIKDEIKMIAPSEFEFLLVWNELERIRKYKQMPADVRYTNITLSCWNKQNQILELDSDDIKMLNSNKNVDIFFNGACLYWQKWTYTYTLNVSYYNSQNMVTNYSSEGWLLKFDSEFEVYVTTTTSTSSKSKTERVLPTNWEFLLWKAPAKITIKTDAVFRDFWLSSYKVKWDMDWDWVNERENQVSFDYNYRVPRVYYPRITFDDLWEFVYSFPVRVEQSEIPVCRVELENIPSTSKYTIRTEFADVSSASIIDRYNYRIINSSTNKEIERLNDDSQERVYEFPEKWRYKVVLDYVTIDWKNWWCESDDVNMKKESFDIKYTLMQKGSNWKFKEFCTSSKSDYLNCSNIPLDAIGQDFQIQIKSVLPSSNTVRKVVYLNERALLNEEDMFNFTLDKEWTFSLKIVVSDEARWMAAEERLVTFTVKKPDIVWKISIVSRDTREPVDEWFEPLTVILDASKTEINIPDDEIVYFTWDFWDWQISTNQQNWITSHTYNYDYVHENWVFTPKVTVKTKKWKESTFISPVMLNIKKELMSVELSSPSHPTRQAKIWKNVSFQADFDWMPGSMIWDFWDGSAPTSCPTRSCSEVMHTFKSAWSYTVKLTLDFDEVQKIDSIMEFKVFE